MSAFERPAIAARITGMSISNFLPTTAAEYELAALEYMRNLPLEHFMEATPHAMQREITMVSLRLLKGRRPDVHPFNELLVQYKYRGRLGQVVPDNMLVLGDLPARDRLSYSVENEPLAPYLTFEYVSAGREQKDYRDSFAKYERELKTPYCLMFQIQAQDLRVSKHNGQRYELQTPNERGRIAIDRLDIEVGILDRWVRFWHQGDLLELPLEIVGRIESMAAIIESQAGQLEAQAGQIKGLTGTLRREVERRARAAARQDILDQLVSVIDPAKLEEWLKELD
jgi:Uma2 family endonuclease